VYDYKKTTGIDLYHRCITELTGRTAKLMELDGRIRRMGFLMVEAIIRKLSRMELLYRCVDLDTTYRENAEKRHRGYSAHIEETVGRNGSVVTDYQFEKNNVSNSVLLKNHLEGMDEQQESTILITDGTYSGIDNRNLAVSETYNYRPDR